MNHRIALVAGAIMFSLVISVIAEAPAQENRGTETRPVLTAKEANGFTMKAWFAKGGTVQAPKSKAWKPESIELPATTEYTVATSGAKYDTIQKAVNAACKSGTKGRVFIQVLPGTYTGTVYIPIDAPEITLYGTGAKPSDVNIELSIDAMLHPFYWQQAVNPAGQYAEGDPAWYMYKACSDLEFSASRVDTPCAAVLWVQNDGFQLKNLTVTNTLLDSVNADTHQAVAVRIDGDKAQVENVRMISRQDTLWANSGDKAAIDNKQGAYSLTRIARQYYKDCYIEGDTDFVMGRATAVFDACEFRLVTTRKPATSKPGIVFAPDTLPANPYGFLVINSRFTTDAGYAGAPNKATLGRSWDQGTSGTGYIAGESPDGQLVIRDSTISADYNLEAPWYPGAATSNRPFKGSVDPARNLNDHVFSRIWEYNNTVAK